MSAAALALHGVGLRIGQVPILESIDLDVCGGEIVALIGPNGAGKSSVLKVASRVVRPTAGRVTIGGRDIAALPRRTLARELAALEQEITATFDFTVGEIVALGRLAHRNWLGVPLARDATAVTAAMRALAIAGIDGRSVRSLSSGERQRVWLAMALAQEPRVLLLDEPTAHLDLGAESATLGAVRAMAEGGLAVLWATHDLVLAAAYADRLVLLRDGRIVAGGPAEEVLSEESIRELYGAEVRVLRDRSGRLVALLRGPGATAPAGVGIDFD